MSIQFLLSGMPVKADMTAGMLLTSLLWEKGCYNAKQDCETANCGLCTMWLDEKPVSFYSILAARVHKHAVTALECLQEEAKEFGRSLAGEGVEQCGFCDPSFIMNVLAMEKELTGPTEGEIREYLAGNLCHCAGYMGQFRAIRKCLHRKDGR